MPAIKLYRHPLSGHSHRVELFLSILGIMPQVIDVDVLNGEHKQPAFLKKNAFAQVPVLQDEHIVLADSNAILCYLARKYDPRRTWFPTETVAATHVQRFLSIASGPIAAGPATARLINVFGAQLDHNRAIEQSHALFAVLNTHLQSRTWLAGENPTIADIANYTYIAHAPEGDVSLADYPNIRAWLESVEHISGFIPMQTTKTGLAA